MTCWHLSPEQKEGLHREGSFIGGLLVLVVAALTFLFDVLLLCLRWSGILSADALTRWDLGLGNVGYMLLYACVYTVSMGGTMLLCCRLCKRSVQSFITFEPVRTTTGIAAVFAGVGGCIMANMIASVLGQFVESFGIHEPRTPSYLDGSAASLMVGLLVWAILPALLEELVFRGCILGALRRYGDWFAISVSAVLFGLIHGGISQSVFALLVGLLLGYVTVSTDSILPAMVIHFANNALSVWLQHATLGMSETDAAVLYVRMLFTIAFFGIAVAVICAVSRSPLIKRLPSFEHSLGERLGVLWTSPLMIIGTILVLLRILMIYIL